MLGYLKPSFKNMPQELKKEYKAHYCGLCHTLKSRYGYVGLSCLNYELTLFLLILNGLSPEKQQFFRGSCSLTPFYSVRYVDYLHSKFLKAADLTILIADYEVADNIKDDKRLKWKMANVLLAHSAKKSKVNLESELFEIDEAIKSYYLEENSDNAIFYNLVKLSGEMIENIILPLFEDFDDSIKFLIAELSVLLGRWIYLMDACEDLDSDTANNKFNPLMIMQDIKDINNIIKSIEIKISEIVKRLPLFNYQQLIEYILVDNLSQKSNQILINLKVKDETI